MKKGNLAKATALFFAVMICFTVLSRAADQAGIAVVRTERPQNMTISHTVKAAGRVEQNQDLAVVTEPDQRVTAIYVREGQRVKSGDPLFALDETVIEEKILYQQQEMEKQKLSVKDAKSQKDVSAQQKANEQAQASEQYALSTRSAGVRLSRAKEQLAQAKKELKAFQESSGAAPEDGAVEASLEQALADRADAYIQAQQELTTLQWEIEQAVYTAQQQAQSGASLAPNRAVHTGASAQEPLSEEPEKAAETGESSQEVFPTEPEADAASGKMMQAAFMAEPEVDAVSGEMMQEVFPAEPEADAASGEMMQAVFPTEPEADAVSGEMMQAVFPMEPEADAVSGELAQLSFYGNDDMIIDEEEEVWTDTGAAAPAFDDGFITDIETIPGSSGLTGGSETPDGSGNSGLIGGVETPDGSGSSGLIGDSETPDGSGSSGLIGGVETPDGSGSSGLIGGVETPDGSGSSGLNGGSETPDGSGNSGLIGGVETPDGSSGSDFIGGSGDSSGAPAAVTQAELDRIEQSVRSSYAQALQAAQQKVEDALAAREQAEAALVQYQQERMNAGSAQSAEAQQQLIAKVQAAQQAYEDAAIAANEAAVTSGRAVAAAGIPNASNSSDRMNEITYEQMELSLKKLEALKADGGEVYAPADGLVLRIDIQTGGKTTDTAAVLMADTQKGCRFTADVTKEQEKFIGTGDLVTLRGASGKTELSELPVEAVAADEEDKSVFHITVQVPDGAFEIGASVELEYEKKSEVYPVTVPVSALHIDEKNQAYVLVAESYESIMGTEQRARSVGVTVLEQNETLAALAEGALGRDQAVITGADRTVDDGSRVRTEE